jgi:hypothetical protein
MCVLKHLQDQGTNLALLISRLNSIVATTRPQKSPQADAAGF